MITSNFKRVVIAFSLILLLSMSVIPAFAQTGALVADSTQFAFIGSEIGNMGMLRVVLPNDTPLPATVEVSVPKRHSINWFGEITGDDPSKDPAIEYELAESRGEFDIYKATLNKAPVVQVEFSAAMPVKNDSEGNALIKYEYAPALETRQLILAAEVPANAHILDTSLESIGKGYTGNVFGRIYQNVAANETKALEVGYMATSASTAAPGAASQTNETAIVIIVVAGIVLIGAVIMLLASNRAKKNAPVDGSATKVTSKKPAAKAPASAPSQKTSSAKTDTQSGAKKVGLSPRALLLIITLIIAIIAIVAMAFSGMNQSAGTKVGETYFREFAQGDPCANATFELSEEAKSDPAKYSKQLFDIMQNADFQILSASFDPVAGTLLVNFCESKASEQMIDDLLRPTNLIGRLNTVPLGIPITNPENGHVTYYFSKTAPCVLNAYKIESPVAEGEEEAFVEKLALAVRNIPSTTIIYYAPQENIVEFGYCEEQANDEAFTQALKDNGVEAVLIRDAEPLQQQEQQEGAMSEAPAGQ